MDKENEKRPLTAVIVGAGNRGMLYASYASTHPDELRIVGVADPSPFRRARAAGTFGIPPEGRFASVEDLAARGRIADFAINGTMDQHHVATSIPLVEAGYDLLLEKPIATRPEDMFQLAETARRRRTRIFVCHVLRYTPFYSALRERVQAGEIGELLNLQLTEHVGYHHMATAFVRGKWGRRNHCQSAMLMAKCCHDLDLMTWLKSGVEPVAVSSFGSRMFFRPEKAPEGAGTRCLVDCPIEPECSYSARKLYLGTAARWPSYVWADEEESELSEERKAESLRTTNPHGRCVWRCDNDVVDHQTVAVEFADGATGTLNMVGGAARPSRCIHLIGATGEIEGKFEDSRFVIRRLDADSERDFTEEEITVDIQGDMYGMRGGHGGGDMRLVADFLRVLRGGEPSPSCTDIEESITGHRIGFAADEAMLEKRVVVLDGSRASAGRPDIPARG